MRHSQMHYQAFEAISSAIGFFSMISIMVLHRFVVQKKLVKVCTKGSRIDNALVRSYS